MELSTVNERIKKVSRMILFVGGVLPIVVVGIISNTVDTPWLVQTFTGPGCYLYSYKYPFLYAFIAMLTFELVVRYLYQIKYKQSYNIKTIYSTTKESTLIGLVSELHQLFIAIGLYAIFSFMWDHCGG